MLLTFNKILFIKYLNNITKWLVYLSISNMSHKMQASQRKIRKTMFGFILTYKRNFF